MRYFFKTLNFILLIFLGLVMTVSLAEAKQKKHRTIRYEGIDSNHDGTISRKEWPGSTASFKNHDWNEDGVLSGEEVESSWIKVTNQENDESAQLQRFSMLDYNRDGSLSFSEWNGTRVAFNKMDKNGNGLVSRREYLGLEDEVATTKTYESFRELDVNRNDMISRNEWRGTPQAFQQLDLNQNGYLTKEEYLGQAATPSQGNFQNLDRDRNNYISRTEWYGTSAEFARLDQNRDNQLTLDEYLGYPSSSSTQADSFSRYDLNNDGYIERNEWRQTSRAFDQMDRNGDQRLNRSEYYNRTQNRSALFSEMDNNQDGYISQSEWRGNSADFSRLDRNRDNLVTRSEFNGNGTTTIVQQIFDTIFQ